MSQEHGRPNDNPVCTSTKTLMKVGQKKDENPKGNTETPWLKSSGTDDFCMERGNSDQHPHGCDHKALGQNEPQNSTKAFVKKLIHPSYVHLGVLASVHGKNRSVRRAKHKKAQIENQTK